MKNTVETLESNQIVFPRLGIDINLDSTAFTLFGIDIQWYGILITLGMVLAMIYAFRRMPSYGISPDRAIDGVLAGIIGAIIGARAYYVILEWDNYAGDWKSIFNLRQGGLAIYGGLIGALLVGCTVAKLRKVRLLPLLDLVGTGFLLGQGIGRWGNFFNQEAFGKNTDNIFGMSGGQIQSWIQNSYPSSNFYENFEATMDAFQTVHPCFLYESVWCLIGFFVLAVVSKKWRKFDGQIFLMYIGWYGLGRFFIEGLRVDSLVIGNVRISQVVAAMCVIISLILLIVQGNRVRRLGDDYKLYKDTEESKQLLAESFKAKKEKKSNDSDVEISELEKSEKISDKTEEKLPAEDAEQTQEE